MVRENADQARVGFMKGKKVHVLDLAATQRLKSRKDSKKFLDGGFPELLAAEFKLDAGIRTQSYTQ